MKENLITLFLNNYEDIKYYKIGILNFQDPKSGFYHFIICSEQALYLINY